NYTLGSRAESRVRDGDKVPDACKAGLRSSTGAPLPYIGRRLEPAGTVRRAVTSWSVEADDAGTQVRAAAAIAPGGDVVQRRRVRVRERRVAVACESEHAADDRCGDA